MLHEISKSVKKNDADIGFGFDDDKVDFIRICDEGEH